MKMFFIRLKTCFYILTGRYKHWVLINLSEEELRGLLTEKEYGTELMFHRLVPYNFYKICKDISYNLDEDDMLLKRIAFETEAELNRQSKLN